MSRVTVIGTGLLGSGIAEVLMRNGHEIVLHDFSLQALNEAHRKLSALGNSIDMKVTLERSLDSAVESAEFIVEAVIENLELKQALFERIGDVNRRAIIMSNSSVLPIGAIARRTTYPERTLGSHWWNPPQLIPIVEIIRGPRTGDDVMDVAIEFHTALGKMPIRVDRDVPGFIGNRIQHALWREALSLVSNGECDSQNVDRIVAATLGATFRQCGPFEQMQRIGRELVTQELQKVLPLINSDPQPAKLLREKVALGHLGAKSGHGFQLWDAGARERAAASLSDHVRKCLREPDCVERDTALFSDEEELIASRLRVAVWREALALVANKVCTSTDVDRVVRNTIGLRLAEMGPVKNADYVGLDLTLAIHEALLPSLESSTALPALDAMSESTNETRDQAIIH